MQLWCTSLSCSLYVSDQYLGDVDICCGIYQGDSLSPLLFVFVDAN